MLSSGSLPRRQARDFFRDRGPGPRTPSWRPRRQV